MSKKPVKSKSPRTIRFTEAEELELERAIARHGSFKSAVMAGLRAELARNDMSQADVLRWIKDHTK